MIGSLLRPSVKIHHSQITVASLPCNALYVCIMYVAIVCALCSAIVLPAFFHTFAKTGLESLVMFICGCGVLFVLNGNHCSAYQKKVQFG